MAWFKKTPEVRTIENPNTPVTAQAINWGGSAVAGVNVTLENALTVPAVWAAVEFISGTIASLPLNVYEKTETGRVKMTSGLQTVIHDAVNDETSSFDWRKYTFERILTGGRSITYIERSNGRVVNLWPMDPADVTIKRSSNRKTYEYSPGGDAKPVTYAASEIIDIFFSVESDGITSISPILTNKDAIALAIAATNYGSKFFNNGGVPPFVMTGNFQTGSALNRASNDLQNAIQQQTKENRLALTLPAGHEIKPIGADPEKSQLVDLKRFQVEEIARIYSLPPVFLQDLTHGTFSNTEQQDLHLVKHTLRRWITQVEQEMNLKLFGRDEAKFYVEFNLDGLLRGDFSTRMSGYATGIQNAILTPNEARAQENRPDKDLGNDLLVQGATVPLGQQKMGDTNV